MKPLSVYLAGRYGRRQELAGYAAELGDRGVIVTSQWLAGPGQRRVGGTTLGPERERAIEAGTTEAFALRGECASQDLADIAAADVLIAFTEPPTSAYSRGGRHVELGVALATNKTVIVVGPRENVFHCLPGLWHYDDWASCLAEVWPLVPAW